MVGMSETYTLPTRQDPDNDTILIDVTLPSSPSSFIDFKDLIFTFTPKEEDSSSQYEIKIVLTD
jgi:hypothetical protein